MSGNAHGLLGPVDDPDHDPPIRAGGHQAELVVGLAAATATLAALYRQRQTGSGCHVQLSAFEAMVNQLISGLANCAYGQSAPTRDLKQVKEAAIGGMVTAIQKNPNVALLYRDNPTRSTLIIKGVARIDESPEVVEKVWNGIQDVEQKHETRESGCAMIIDVKSIGGGTPKGGVRVQRQHDLVRQSLQQPHLPFSERSTH